MSGQEVEIRKPMAVASPELIGDDELRRMMRIAEAFALSGIYKDVTKAQQALAKMVIGRDLGLGVAQSMQAVQFVEGAIQLHYSMIGSFIKAHGLDYRVTAHDSTVCEIELLDGPNGNPYDPPKISRYTVEDAILAGKVKPDMNKRDVWYTSRPDMLFARAMSKLPRRHCPEVLGGIPVYVPGEIEPGSRAALTAGEGDAPAKGLELGPEVDAVIRRAEQLGHAGLSDRATIEMTLGGRSPAMVPAWVRSSTAELDEWERVKAGKPPAVSEPEPDEPEVVDAQVVADKPPATLDERYAADPALAAQVDALTGNYADRQCVLEEAGGDMAGDEELARIAGKLDALGFPAEWFPAPQAETLFGGEA
jgi:hypothetical protein